MHLFVMSTLFGGGVSALAEHEALAGDQGSRGGGGAGKPKGKGKDKPDLRGPFKKKDYPMAERLRPLVLPNGMGEVGVELPIEYSSFSTAGVSGSSATFGTNVSFAYGIGDLVELGLSPGLGITLAPDVFWDRTIVPRVAWLAADGKMFDFAPGVSIPLTFGSSTSTAVGTGTVTATSDTSIGVTIDLNSRYLLSDGFYLFFGKGAVPVGVSPGFALGLNVEGGLGYQINKQGALLIGTSPLQLTLSPAVGATGLWTTPNISITGQYTPSRNVDLGLTLAPAYTLEAKAAYVLIQAYGAFRF